MIDFITETFIETHIGFQFLKRSKRRGVDEKGEVLHNLASLLLTNTTLRSEFQMKRRERIKKEIRSLTINSQ